MATNLAINNDLLSSALKIGRLKTKRETVNAALEEFVQRRKKKEAIELFGTIEFHKNWNPKKARGKA
jgi:Arc/MetJ family transcription regulator